MVLMYFQASTAAYTMFTDQLTAHHTGRPVRERAGIDQVGNFLLSRLGANGITSNEFNNHLTCNSNTAETPASSCGSQRESTSSRRKSPPVPTTLKLEQSSDSFACRTKSDADLVSAKRLNKEVKNEKNCDQSCFEAKVKMDHKENGEELRFLNGVKKESETNNTEHEIKLHPTNRTVTTENGELSPMKDEVDVNLNLNNSTHVHSGVSQPYNHFSFKHFNNSSSNEDSLSGSDFSIRKVNLQQSLRRGGQTEPRIRAIQRLYKGRSTSCSPPATNLSRVTGATGDVTSPYVSPRCSPAVSPKTSPPRQDFTKVLT